MLFYTLLVLIQREFSVRLSKCLNVSTLYCTNSYLRSFSGYNLRKALFVYRLIVATIIGIYFWWSILKLKSKFWLNVPYMARCAVKGQLKRLSGLILYNLKIDFQFSLKIMSSIALANGYFILFRTYSKDIHPKTAHQNC